MLTTRQVRTGDGARAPFRILRNRVHLGEATSGYDEEGYPKDVLEDAHAPLTDPVTYQAAQDRRSMRATHQHDPVLVARGLVRCAGRQYVAMVDASAPER